MVTVHDIPTANSKAVLFIDGNDQDRHFFADRLKTCLPGHRIIESETGQAGLSLYQSRSIDCVVLELDLPDMSGFEILFELIPAFELPDFAVIVLTRFTNPDIAALAVKNGAMQSLVKARTTGEVLCQAVVGAIAHAAANKAERYRRVDSQPCETL
ncbi:hypothetical protein W02_10440 [Nitrospira sp. KM1]|uniref:response regulator n=1 Tax=Nitrospira sp. KM1 TaxID=1936990 RepID=UPI0013A7B38D|nr:response regulator [Nitrospira sp. KM1]BCA53904.1 hypothetical protein W02_10440 [Nitrospira sp. KM1]